MRHPVTNFAAAPSASSSSFALATPMPSVAVSFSLADFDAGYSDRTILLADHEDGAPLSDTAGPLRLIVSGDKKAARWERMVTSIEIIDPDELKH
jgi:hypothetical protein